MSAIRENINYFKLNLKGRAEAFEYQTTHYILQIQQFRGGMGKTVNSYC